MRNSINSPEASLGYLVAEADFGMGHFPCVGLSLTKEGVAGDSVENGRKAVCSLREPLHHSPPD